MIVHFELRRFEDTPRQLSLQRRNDWLPTDRLREVLQHDADEMVYREYTLDHHASAERGRLVYQQIPA
jgi:hypothetical protein